MFEIRALTLAEAASLRTRILRPSHPPGQLALYDADRDPRTRHFGAVDAHDVIGCATFLSDPWPAAPEAPACRLRGMAVSAGFRDQGVGAQIMRFALDALPSTYPNDPWLWCNARVRAASFYARLGFVQVGDVFEIPGIGPHVRMRRRLTGS